MTAFSGLQTQHIMHLLHHLDGTHTIGQKGKMLRAKELVTTQKKKLKRMILRNKKATYSSPGTVHSEIGLYYV